MLANCKSRRKSGLWVEDRYGEEISPAVRQYMDAQMLLANGTFATSEGETAASHTPTGGAEHQVVMLAHASGHIRGTIPTYSWWRTFTAGANTQRTIDLFNASGSGVDVKIRKLFLHHNQATVVGVPHNFDVIHTTTVGTAGTVLTGRLSDSAEAAIPAQVTCRMNATGGAAESYIRFGFSVHTEETLPATGMSPMINWLAEGEDIGDVVLHEGQGILVKQMTNSTVGVFGCWLVASIVAA